MRFKAEWCTSDGPQDGLDFDPDLVVYESEIFMTQKDASEHARKMAAKGPTDDWWRVEERDYVPQIYQGVDIGRWETIATWISDEYIE